MSHPVIQVEGLGKRYLLSHQGPKSEGLRHRLEGFARAPLRWLKKTLWQKQSVPLMNGKLNGSLHRVGPKAEFWALRDISFEVKQGEVIGIIGRNGAGKSTLLKILSRITEPTTGKVLINGRVASLLEVGTGFHPELTGRENIFLNGAILGMSKVEIKKKFDEIVAFAEIERFLDTPVKHYSSGMYVRLAFAVAAHLEPEILIVDEVLAVGDVQFQKKCLGKMGDASQSGRTVLFVSHNMTAVKTLCRYALLLDKAKLVGYGGTQELVKQYLRQGERSSEWEVAWKNPTQAPGNDIVRLLRVAVKPAGDISVTDVEVAVPLDIEIDYHNARAGSVINASLVLYTQEDICVLNSVSESEPRTAGTHRATCRIPGGLLNDEVYRVRVLLVQDSSQPLIDIDHLLTFQLHDGLRRNGWLGKWVGVVRPALRWDCRQLNPELLPKE